MNHSVAMQHHIEEICRLKLWDKDQLSAATKNLHRSIEQTPYSIQADTVCCLSVSRCHSESSSRDGYAPSDGGDSPRSNEHQLHYPSHAHMDTGDVLLLLPGSVTQLEDIFRKCEVTFGPDYKELLLQAFLDKDNSVKLSSFFNEPDIPWILRGRRTSMDPSESTKEQIEMLKINTQVLCLMQQQLCEQSGPFDELKIGYFAVFAKCPIDKLLGIAAFLSKKEWLGSSDTSVHGQWTRHMFLSLPATRICPMLLAYEALHDVRPLIQKLPSSDSDEDFPNILCNMSKALRRLIDQMKLLLESNMENPQDDAIHAVTCFLILSVRYFSSHRNLVQSILAPGVNSDSFGHLLHDVITCWKSELTKHSNVHCADPLWRYIVLLNNTHHFNSKTRNLLEELLSDRQIIKQHHEEFRLLFDNWIERYTEEACAPAKYCLNRNYFWGSPRACLVAFTSKFYKSFDRQKTWKVPDVDLRQELQHSIENCLLSDYSSSFENNSSSGVFSSCLQIGSAGDIITPEDLQADVRGLFEG